MDFGKFYRSFFTNVYDLKKLFSFFFAVEKVTIARANHINSAESWLFFFRNTKVFQTFEAIDFQKLYSWLSIFANEP